MKQTKKQIKRQAEINNMIKVLEIKWSNPVKYTCVNCLKEAYLSVINDTNGYVTDDDLIKSSNNKLKHK
jgi:hypothetical protein